jgi:hypothetical protein
MSDPKKDAAPAAATPPQKTLVVLVNNQERVELIGVPGNETTFLGTEITSQRGRGLLPGVNLVEPTALAGCRENKLFDAKFSTAIPKSVAREAMSENVGQPMLVQGKEVPMISPFSKLSSPEAMELAKKINDEELLVLLISLEGKDEVRRELNNQLVVLRTGAPAEAVA